MLRENAKHEYNGRGSGLPEANATRGKIPLGGSQRVLAWRCRYCSSRSGKELGGLSRTLIVLYRDDARFFLYISLLVSLSYPLLVWAGGAKRVAWMRFLDDELTNEYKRQL